MLRKDDRNNLNVFQNNLSTTKTPIYTESCFIQFFDTKLHKNVFYYLYMLTVS